MNFELEERLSSAYKSKSECPGQGGTVLEKNLLEEHIHVIIESLSRIRRVVARDSILRIGDVGAISIVDPRMVAVLLCRLVVEPFPTEVADAWTGTVAEGCIELVGPKCHGEGEDCGQEGEKEYEENDHVVGCDDALWRWCGMFLKDALGF